MAKQNGIKTNGRLDTAMLEKAFKVTQGRKFNLSDFQTDNLLDTQLQKSMAPALLDAELDRLRVLQEKLYAQDRWSLLLIFQAMDAAGKDSTIKHVMSGVNPQGCHVASFKQPTSNELDHNYMWRTNRQMPARGKIGIFNRSYYEEVLVVRVHPEILTYQKLPDALVTPKIWQERLTDIASFERYWARNGTVVRKFFLNVSKDEQKERFLKRLDDPRKHWKFSSKDVEERQYWDDYQRAYEAAIKATASRHAPWYVIPADRKWFMRLVVMAVIIETLESLDLHYPEVATAEESQFAAMRQRLMEGA